MKNHTSDAVLVESPFAGDVLFRLLVVADHAFAFDAIEVELAGGRAPASSVFDRTAITNFNHSWFW